MKRSLTILLAAALCAWPGLAGAQTNAPAAPPALDDSARALVRGSREAFLAAGFSAAYFDRHFSPFKVVNLPGDRRVVWRFRAGGHETYVDDSVGFYTDEGGRRVDTHSVASTLAPARDPRRVITRVRAERLMRACIGEFEGGAVVFQQFGARAALVFTAATVSPPSETVAAPPAWREAAAGGDPLRRGGRRGPPVYVGAVNLETGRCIKGRARAGAPGPSNTAPPPAN